MSKEDWKGACLHPDCVAVVEWLSGKMPNSAVKCVVLSEAELDGVAGGMIKQPGPERRRYCQYYLWPRAYRSHAVVLALRLD